MITKQTPPAETREVLIPSGEHHLPGLLCLPEAARAVVVFVHGSGSSRLSPRNQYVAEVLQQGGLGTLLFDLLEEDEAEDRRKVFDIALLADRLQDAVVWLRDEPQTAELRVGFFGASTGAAAAIVAAARHPEDARAVVSRGGRPDLAWGDLQAVHAPTLLIVGGMDELVQDLNDAAFRKLRCKRKLVVVPGATHLFPEPGALEDVAHLARDWFVEHLLEESAADPETQATLRDVGSRIPTREG